MAKAGQQWVRKTLVASVALACAGSALALEFETDGGWRGSLNTTVGVSAGWRMQDPDKKLILAKNAAAAGIVDGFEATDTYPGYPTAQFAGNAALRGTIATLIATTTPGSSVVATAGAAALRVATGKSPVTNLTLAQALVAAGVPVSRVPEMVGNTLASVNGAVFATLSAAGNNATGLGIAAGTVQVAGAGAATAGAIGAIAGMAAAQAGVAAGYLGGAPTDDANLNYKKGDRYSTNLKVLSELSLQKGDTGGLLRVKGWYDDAMNNVDVSWGHQLSGYAHNKPYSDNGVELLNRYNGIALLDAYAYTSVDVGDMPMQIRLGRQAVNWGESLFIQGVNQLTPLDVTALRKPGTEIKEALLPVWSVYANLGLPAGMSLEGFYQFKWEPSAIDTCGTYWSPVGTGLGSTPGLCNMATSLGFGGLSNRWAYLGSDGTGPIPGPGTASIASIDGRDAKNGGQWGVALRFPVDAIDTEFGLYAMNIHSRVPILSGRVSSMLNSSYYNPATRMVAFWEYPEDIQIYGLSAATTLYGWSVGAELSLQKDVPVQINGNDMLLAGLLGSPTALGKAGPVGDRVAAARARMVASGSTASAVNGEELRGYDRYDKKQFQVNGVYLLPSLLGATNGTFVAEAGFQWSNVPKSDGTNVRYGRAFIYGFGSHSKYYDPSGTLGGLGGDTCSVQIGGTSTLNQSATNPNPTGCKNDGYINDFAWGYRLRASLDYPNVFETGWTATPSIFFLHDVDGYSMDTQFNEGRKAISLGLRMSLNKVHNVDLGYTTYSNSAKYDAFRDRDNLTFAYSYTF